MQELGAELDEAGGGEVAVEGERAADPQRAHQREAGGVDEGVLALVVAAEPDERVLLQLGRDEVEANPARFLEAVQEVDGGPVPGRVGGGTSTSRLSRGSR